MPTPNCQSMSMDSSAHGCTPVTRDAAGPASNFWARRSFFRRSCDARLGMGTAAALAADPTFSIYSGMRGDINSGMHGDASGLVSTATSRKSYHRRQALSIALIARIPNLRQSCPLCPRYCCKSRKSNDPRKISRKWIFRPLLLLRRYSAPLRRSVVDFGRDRYGPSRRRA